MADANRCRRAVWTKAWGFATIFGDEGDLDAVELLHTSLLVQATRAMVLEPRPAGRSGGGARTCRDAFRVAFAEDRVGQRLAEAADSVTDERPPVTPRRSSRCSPPGKAEAADRALGEAFPETRHATGVRSRRSRGAGRPASRPPTAPTSACAGPVPSAGRRPALP